MADLTENELLWAESLRGQLIKSDDRDLFLRLVNDYRRLRAALAGARREGVEQGWCRAEHVVDLCVESAENGDGWNDAWQAAKAAHLKELG